MTTKPGLLFTWVRSVKVERSSSSVDRSCFVADKFPGVQFYPVCVQVEVTGDGTAFPTSFVSFPGAYTPDTPGMRFLPIKCKAILI
jgi:hypothetical protein